MYELERGSKRLATALMSIKTDTYTLQRLADYLHYRPQQLAEDIDAIYNRVYQREEEAGTD